MPKKNESGRVRRLVGSNVRYARTMLRWSQEKLAERSGLHRTGLGSLERGETAATIDSVASLSSAIGVDPHVLLMQPKDAQPIILAAIGSEERAS